MEKSYEFNRDVLLAHIEQWKRRQRRDRYPDSYRALGEHVGLSHTYFHHLYKGQDGKRPTTRMNYDTALKFSEALEIPLPILLPKLFAVPENDKRKAAA